MIPSKNQRIIGWSELLVIIVGAASPLFFTLFYRINIFLSWEGAYRLYLGQLPFRDFGLPMGFGYWIIPAVFFKLFGPYLATLVKAQIFINIISGMTFRAILKLFDIEEFKRFLSVLIYCLTFILGNLWPWYNHTVIVYELIGLYFTLHYILKIRTNHSVIFLAAGCFFLFLSFFTKQDAGALGILLAAVLILYTSYIEKSFKPLGLFSALMIIVAGAFILPFIQYDFLYWFNYGQFPHNARISIRDFISIILGESRWEKFYLLVIGVIVYNTITRNKEFYLQKKEMIFALFTVGILIEALLFQVTSYVPKNNHIFFHSFCFAFIIGHIKPENILAKRALAPLLVFFVLLWWSESYWKYVDRIIISKLFPVTAPTAEGVVGVNSFSLPTPCDTLRNADTSTWGLSDYPSFKNVMMPRQTVAGIDYVMNLTIVKQKGSAIRFLNMSELTPLAFEMGFTSEKNQPLWYHLGVGTFAKELHYFCSKVENQYYDLVLFEYIPALNNFYPFPVRQCLQKHYTLRKTFKAPRSDFQGVIEVYEKP